MSTAVRRSPRQREHAYLRLREMLLVNRIPEGTRLRETHWSEELCVNRMALREALARLAGEGFIVRGAKTGYYVPKLTEADIREIRRTRLILECGAIAEIAGAAAATNATPATVLRRLMPLRRACDDLERFLKKGYHLGVAEADRRFHECLVDAAGNRRLSALYRGAPLPLIRTELVGSEQWQHTAERTAAAHRAIVQAIAAGRPLQAMRLLAEHLSVGGLPPITD